jgi:AcrR family transcriptional regulator
MTNQGDSLARRQAYPSHPVTRRRDKLAPDPDVRRAIVAAASKTIREQGVRGLSVAAVLDRAHLSTRAFYRHFESKDQLVAAVFLEVTRTEVLRLRTKMAGSVSPVEAVAAWIEGRLDLAFDEHIKSELRQVSQEANAAVFSSPELVSPAYDAILEATHRAASAGAGTRHLSRHRSADRRQVDTRRDMGTHPAAMGNRSLGTRRGSQSCAPFLPARIGRGARNNRTNRCRHAPANSDYV